MKSKTQRAITSLLITNGILIVIFGWVGLLSIDGMSDWYYGSLFFLPFFILLWGGCFYLVTLYNKVPKK